jgi:Zn-dependent protease
VVACEPPSRLRALRVGVAPNAPHQLLAIEARIEPEGQGSRLELRYEWGPRNLLAQLFARTEIRSSVGRLKHLAETGKRDEGIEARSSLLLAIATGALTLLGFGAWLGWTAAVLILIVVVIHEAGHLIAFRMLGQGWGRLFFIPFLGAIAVPRWPFRSQWQRAIAALMGPGLSAILLLGPLVAPDTAKPVLAQLAWIAAVINGLNLLPVLPLDGGHSLDAVLTSFGGRSVTWGMPIAAALVAAAGLLVHEPILFAVALLVLISRRPVEGAVPLSSMSTLAAALVLCLHLGLAALYAIAVLTLAA